MILASKLVINSMTFWMGFVCAACAEAPEIKANRRMNCIVIFVGRYLQWQAQAVVKHR